MKTWPEHFVPSVKRKDAGTSHPCVEGRAHSTPRAIISMNGDKNKYSLLEHTCEDIGRQNEGFPAAQPPSASSVPRGAQRFLEDVCPSNASIMLQSQIETNVKNIATI